MALLLLGRTSWYHNADSIIVKSRDGGFVTQNCAECGTPRALKFIELPHLQCRCGANLSPGKSCYGNYAYSCQRCGKAWELHTLVPKWVELFEYCGYGLPTDEHQPISNVPQNTVDAILQAVRATIPSPGSA